MVKSTGQDNWQRRRREMLAERQQRANRGPKAHLCCRFCCKSLAQANPQFSAKVNYQVVENDGGSRVLMMDAGLASLYLSPENAISGVVNAMI